ncbi:IS3 family transposase [Actinomadura rugatobispora]|uniref:IS3 family transposase n=1 Tax=Actinomadura rugatobispora TaxID=1994 RepID=A0ABW1A2M2_9ACTN
MGVGDLLDPVVEVVVVGGDAGFAVGDGVGDLVLDHIAVGVNRQRWKTRIELANAIFEYLEIFHNRRRRHSALGMLSPVEYERLHSAQQLA